MTVTDADPFLKISARRTLNVRTTLNARPIHRPEFDLALRPALLSVVVLEQSASPIITLPNAPVQPQAVTLLVIQPLKVAGALNVLLIRTAPPLTPVTNPATLANPSARRTAAERTPSVWQRITWPCAPARLVTKQILIQRLNVSEWISALLNLVTHPLSVLLKLDGLFVPAHLIGLGILTRPAAGRTELAHSATLTVHLKQFVLTDVVAILAMQAFVDLTLNAGL